MAAAQQGDSGSAGLPMGLKIAGGVVGGLVLVALVAWLVTGGYAQVLSVLPPGVVKLLGESPGATKVVPRTPDQDGAPWEHNTRAGIAPHTDEDHESVDENAIEPTADEPKGPDHAAPAVDENAVKVAQKSDEDAAAAAMAPIRHLAERTDDAIAAYLASPDDQAAYLAANRAVDDLRGLQISASSQSLRMTATEFRNELAAKKRRALDDARSLGRATHRVTGTADEAGAPYLVLRESASNSSNDVGHLQDDSLVRVLLDLGSGWVRLQAMDASGNGSYGYAPKKYLAPLKKSARK